VAATVNDDGPLIGIIIRRAVRYPRADNVPSPSQPKPKRVLKQPRAIAVAPAPNSHAALSRALTVNEAHREMQRHTDCSPSRCARKTQALGALAAAGVMVQSTRPQHQPLAGAPRAAIPVTHRK